MNRSKEIEYITNYYNDYDEEGRLLRKFNSLEYITTMKYIKQYLRKEMKILEIGAGTGRYSLTLAEEDTGLMQLILFSIILIFLKAK